MQLPRSAGLLLHISSLPSKYGIGDLGPAAYRFIDFLAAAGQRIWQILPLCPPSAENSPYSSYSAFAGNVLLLSPESMVDGRWLSRETLDAIVSEIGGSVAGDPGSDETQVDFDAVAEFKNRLLAASFDQVGYQVLGSDDFKQYCREQSWWLNAFSQFEALRKHFGEGDWSQWPIECQKQSTVPASLIVELDGAIAFAEFKQYLFDSQWRQLKAYAKERGVQVCGDMPIFVAYDSADVWANQDQFLLDSNGRPTVVAGVPPDYFSETGQLWGNPLYDWAEMESDAFAWWVKRFRRSLSQFDLLRVDHFRGFEKYWEVPADAETAAAGQWKDGPLEKPFDAAKRVLGELPIWAEDLGDIDQPVHDLRDRLDFPTMRVLQFGYDSVHDDFHRHTKFPQHCIAYTGTHDNDTLMGWYRGRTGQSHEPDGDVLAQFLTGDLNVNFQLIDLLYHSAASVAIVPVQDLLGLGTEARMNVPGKAQGNWAWRVARGAMTAELAANVRQQVQASDRG